jgi:hypothetical protein
MQKKTASNYEPWLGMRLLDTNIDTVTNSCSRVSYRDLLGTAERIIEMDSQMQEVEATLGQAAQRCNSGAVDRIFKHYGKFQAEKNKSEKIAQSV